MGVGICCSITCLYAIGVDASPLMTWGNIEGTPVKIESNINPPVGPSFKMPKVLPREKAALKLADQVAKANKDRKKITMMAARFVKSITIINYCNQWWVQSL